MYFVAVPWVGLSLRFYVAGYMQVLAVELNRIELLLLFFLFSHERSRGVMLLVALGKSPPPGSFVTAPTWVSVVDGVASWTIGNYWFAITWQGGYIGGHTINFGRIYMKGSSVPLREIWFCSYHQHACRDVMCKLAIPFCEKRRKNPWKVVFVESRS